MRKIALSIFGILCFTTAFGQARKELNFGLVGINYEIPVHKDITIAPGVGTSLDLDWLNVGVKANYYFDHVFGITNDAWDVYAGPNVGYTFDMRDDNDNNGNDESDINFGLQVGGRWFWNEKWGVYVELAGGNVSGFSPGIGLTMKL